MPQDTTLIALFKEQLENESVRIAQDHSLEKRGDYLIWWYFLRIVGLEPSDLASIVCDGGNDLGIDAIRIDEDNLVHFYQFKNPEKLEQALPSGEIDKLLSGLHVILNRRYEQIANAELKARIEDIYQIIPTGYRLHLTTSGRGISQESQVKLDAFVLSLGAPSDDFFIWQLEDIVYLQNALYQRTLPTVTKPIVFQLDRQAPYQVRSANHDCYMFHSTGTSLALLYTEHGEQLLQQNIRLSQGDSATNERIRQACSGEEAANFLHYNNGVTFLCETAQWDQFTAKMTLNRAQIVNGGQTIRVLSKSADDNKLRAGVLVPVRIITSQGDKEFASDVAVNLNNQNRVESSFLRSNDPRILQLAHAMESLGWYLERRENEVNVLTDEEKESIERRLHGSLSEKTIKLRDAAQAYVATFFRQPELAKSKPGRIFMSGQDGGMFERVFNNELSAEKVILAHRLKSHVDSFVTAFMYLKRRKSRLLDWRLEYSNLLGSKLVKQFGDQLDQVIPQSSIFLCAFLFEDFVTLRDGDKPRSTEKLIMQLETKGWGPLQTELLRLLTFAKDNPAIANKSWPTLLKSQAFFENVASYIKGLQGEKAKK